MFRPLPFLLLVAALPASAQLVTDRPDFTESAVTVSAGRAQIEAGVSFEVADTGAGENAFGVSGPEALVRLRLAPGLEARLGLPDYRVADVTRSDGRGFTDLAVGAKVELARLAGWDVAAIAEIALPVEAAGPASPLAILIAGRDLGAASLGTQVEVRWDRATDRTEVGGTAVVGTALSERVGVFAEVAAGTTPDGTAVLAHTGATLLLSRDLQLDAHGGLGLTAAAPDGFGGVGLSVQF